MSRRGLAIGVAAAIIAVLFAVCFGFFTLMRGVGSGLEGADGHVRALAIAESGTHALIARVFALPWEARWFKGQPEIQDRPVSYGGGSYIYVIQDTPGVPLSFDLWVRSDYRGTRRLLFYRITYEDSLFHGLVSPAVDFTSTVANDAGAPPLNGNTLDPLTRKVNGWIDQRRQTTGDLGLTRQTLAQKVDPLAILRDLDAAMPGVVIPAVASAPGGVSTAVPPPPAAPVPPGGISAVKPVDNRRIFDWLDRQGYEAEFLATLKSRTMSAFAKIEAAIRNQRFLEAEMILRQLMEYLFGRSGEINTLVKLENARYADARQELAARAAAEGWPAEQLAAAQQQLESEHRARLRDIYQRDWAEP